MCSVFSKVEFLPGNDVETQLSRFTQLTQFTQSLYFQDYEDHVASMHYGLWKYKCGWCLKLFDSKIECLKHNKVHRPRKKHEFKNPRPKVKETSEPLICADCGKIYQNKQSLRVHVDHFHNQQDLTFRCNQCENVYNSQAKLKEHIRYKHVLIPCSVCGDMIKKIHMKYHVLQKHTDNSEKPWQCQTCGKGFVHENKLKEHINVHTGAKPFKCKFCPSAFASLGTKATHEKSHLGIKRNK